MKEWQKFKGKPTYAKLEIPEAIKTMQCSKYFKI